MHLDTRIVAVTDPTVRRRWPGAPCTDHQCMAAAVVCIVLLLGYSSTSTSTAARIMRRANSSIAVAAISGSLPYAPSVVRIISLPALPAGPAPSKISFNNSPGDNKVLNNLEGPTPLLEGPLHSRYCLWGHKSIDVLYYLRMG
jgi:hypothetical protein